MENHTPHTIEDLSEGMSETYVRTVTSREIEQFAEVSGDDNPIHLDADYAAETMFGERIAHGMLSAGFISAILGTRLPGPGGIYLSQSLKFKAPVKLGDEVTTTVTVTEVWSEKKRARFETICRVGETVVIDGEAVMLVPSRAS